jgi:hypothetical protein
MPNWCNNKLTVVGPKKDMKRFKGKAIGFSPENGEEESDVFNFHSLVPIPPAVLKASYDKVGHKWEINHWGCKWGAFEAARMDDCKGHLLYTFYTPNSPPVELLHKLGSRWPTLTFMLNFEETEIGFRGVCKVHGDSIEDHWFDL